MHRGGIQVYCTLFFSICQDLYNLVEEHRNELVGYENEEDAPLYEKVEGTDGKVLKLTRFTKTQGSA